MKTTLNQLAKETQVLNEKMEKALVQFVKEHGNLIRTEDTEENKDVITGIVDLEDENGYVERRILAVTTFENTLAVLFAYGAFDSIESFTDDELLELDNWHSVSGGMVLPNATLWALCEFIEEYVD